MDPQQRTRFELLLKAEPPPAAQLSERLATCLAELDAAFAGSAVFNYELARAIGHGCQALLERYDELPDDQRRAVAAAIAWFVDVDDDLDSVLGFDDDAEVFNHVATSLGRYDLVVSLV